MFPKRLKMKPVPPASLSKEFTRVWLGWCAIGDREVAREAAAKGIYISLALQFIATRKDWDHSDVERWFKSEILAWVYQLLEAQQIFKASHILTNIGLDPSEQLNLVLSETTNKTMRDYIAEHLLKNGKLEVSILSMWRFLSVLEAHQYVLSTSEDCKQFSIVKIEQKSREWKSEIATKLFFISYDSNLVHFLTPEPTWTFLLINEKLDIIKLWITIYFSKDLTYESNISFDIQVSQKLKNLFLFWDITADMISQIKTGNHPKFVVDYVLNTLSNFGIFVPEELTNISKIIARFSKSQNIHHIFNILNEPTSNLNIKQFYKKLNQFCVSNELYEVLGVLSEEFTVPKTLITNKQLSLWLEKPKNVDNFDDSTLNHIITALNYFSDSDYAPYLHKNPLILIAIIIFTNNNNLNNILINKTPLEICETLLQSDLILKYLNNLPVMEKIIKKFRQTTETQITIYNLFKNENLTSFFEFRFSNSEIPNFNSKILNIYGGYAENINYLYYIKQNRPGKAAKLFILDQFRNFGLLHPEKKLEALEKVKKLAFKNYSKVNITSSSCIAFIKLIGSSSYQLRILVNTYIVLNEAKITNLDDLFSDLPKNSAQILNILETVLSNTHNLLNINLNLSNFIENYNLAIQFAKLHVLDYPEQFLIKCAEENNWLVFLITSTIFNYPITQVLSLALRFKNKKLIDHITHAILTDPDQLELLSDRMFMSQVSCDFAATDEFVCDEAETNLLKILIKCHKSGDPPTALLQACQSYKNPLLAILATCYEPDSVVTNWLAWLSVSTDIEIDFVENYSISPSAVSELLEKVMENKYSRTLLESFKIFLPENPLHILITFLHCSISLDFNQTNLKQFESSISHLNYNIVVSSNDIEYTFLNNAFWLVNTALKLIFITLGSFDSKTHQITFLATLLQTELTKNIPIDCPDFGRLSNLLQSLSNCDVAINLSVFFNANDRTHEIIRCIELLVNKKDFKAALKLAKYEGICKEYVLNAEWLELFNSHPDVEFWEASNTAFELAQITPSSGAEFYIYCCQNLSDNSEKYRALKYAYKWLKKTEYSDQFVENIETEIWSNYFALDDITLTGSHFSKHETNYLLSEIHERAQPKSRFDPTLDEVQMRHLEEAIGKILESGDIIEAMRLEKMFGVKFPEISILLNCYELAEGRLSPYDISAEQRLLFLNRDKNFNSVSHRRRPIKSTRKSNLISGSMDSLRTLVLIEDKDETAVQDTLKLLESMTERLKYGANIAGRILMCYRIALNTGTPYQDIVKLEDSKIFLNNALERNCKNKLEVVHDIFIIFKWNKSEITELIFDELKKSIELSLDLNLESIQMWNLDLDSEFHLILQLCSDHCSILGGKLLKSINRIDLSSIDPTSINLLIELLVRSHDCYNSYCNMEGIASILRKAQTVTSFLLNTKNWRLMVRLLTGLGRYTELNYIFQILKENDQFEFLLKRNFKKDAGLKRALLKFLKRHCPKNQDLYKMVALHFSLFSEVALLWETEAIEMVDNLIKISKLEPQNSVKNLEFVLFANSESTVLCLSTVLKNFILASEYHVHGEKLQSAMQTAKQAELLALQMSVLKSLPVNSTAKCLLKLNQKQIFTLITTELRFPQTIIVADAYAYQIDWGQVLFHQAVLKGQIDYFDDFLMVKPLTNTLAQDLTRRFLAEKIHSENSVKSMKVILSRLSSVHMKYRLASELGFSDVIEPLLSGSQLAYLKDTVWKKGYKQL